MTHDGHEPPERKNPPRISADGFQAHHFSLKKTPCLPAPERAAANPRRE
jgi:hypothetical protein